MWNSEPTTLAELQAWANSPEQRAFMAEVEEWNYQERLRKWREAEIEQERFTREKAEQERREQEERDRKWRAERDAERQQRAAAEARAAAVQAREARAKHYNLRIRNVRVEQRGDHTIWSTGFRTKRMVHGIASTPTITTNNHSLSSAGCEIDFPIPLLCSHEELGSIGEVVMLRRSPREIYAICALHDDNLAANYAWSLVEQGTLRAFSVASERSKIDGSVLGTRFYGEWKLREISLCKQGANPDCNNVEIFSNRRKICAPARHQVNPVSQHHHGEG
jgi:hypothetical protein